MTGARSDEAELAWAHALESAARSAYRYLGWPEDSGNTNLKSHAEVSWEAAAALSAGVLVLALAAQKQGITWRQVITLAQTELDEIERHLACPAAPSPRDGD